jgi:uncharacterized phiE125 gp8 family phage protein
LRYPIGQPIRLSFTVRDTTGTLVSPGAATLVVKLAAADGTSTTTGTYPSLANDGVGLLHQDIPVTDLAAAGHYQYALTTTGTGAGVSFGEFDVFDPFETSVLSLQDAKDQLNITTTTSDTEIASWIATIESALERYTGGPLVNRQVTERAEMMSNQTVILVRQRPLVSVVSITSASGSAIDISGGLDIDTNAGTVRRKLGLPFYGPFFTWMPVVTVTYVAGWGTAVPAAFGSAARIILAHLWESQRGPASLPGLGGGDMVTPPGFGFAIPNMAAELLDGAQNGIPFANEAFV